MHAESIAVGELQNLIQRTAFQFHVQVEALLAAMLIAWGPIAADKKVAEVLRGTVRAGGRSAEANLDRAVGAGGNRQVRVVKIEERLGVSEFEIHPARAHLDGGNASRRCRGTAQKKLESSKAPRRSSPG